MKFNPEDSTSHNEWLKECSSSRESGRLMAMAKKGNVRGQIRKSQQETPK
jgi:hypothetical protein